MGAGIDYGLGKTNVDVETGIRYGVIHQNHVLQAWADSSEADYGDPYCPECEVVLGDDHVCESCGETIEDPYGEYPLGWYLDDGEYQATCGDSGDIFVLKSPYYTRAAYCSPCAPGACSLTSPCEDGDRAYCFGPDWFDGPPPHPIYRVSDDSLVQPSTDDVDCDCGVCDVCRR